MNAARPASQPASPALGPPSSPVARGVAIGLFAAFALTLSPFLGGLVVLFEVWVRRFATRPGHREFCTRLVKAAVVTAFVVLVLPFALMPPYVTPLG